MQNNSQNNKHGENSSDSPVSVEEYTILLPRNNAKRYHVMRFHASSNVDFDKWGTAKMVRENNSNEFKEQEKSIPKFGAGSEYNRDQKEEIRRKRFRKNAKKYSSEAQPWLLRIGGKEDGRMFRGIRDGGVAQYMAFYVFIPTSSGTIEAYPLEEWYNFQPIPRYKTLSIEEVEEEFNQREKSLNYFNMMRMKRKKGDEEIDEELEESDSTKRSARGRKKGLQISEMDDWIDLDDANSTDDDEEQKKEEKDSDDENKKKTMDRKKMENGKMKKKRAVDYEAFEDSDDGDDEGRELDYVSESSESHSELGTNTELKSVAEEDGLRKLLTSDESSEDEENKSKEVDENINEKVKSDNGDSNSKEKTKTKKQTNNSRQDSFSNGHSSSSDSEAENDISQRRKKNSMSLNKSNSRKAPKEEGNKLDCPVDSVVSHISSSPSSPLAKLAETYSAPRLTLHSSSYGRIVNNYGITEDVVRRYLKRKPITSTELLSKLKNKKVPKEKLLEVLLFMLEKINPTKQNIRGKVYYSLK
ncbi:general transcription factor IIF subunit 1-like [Toxorhynchites rutilus septentrionalis]|uniref:general transcription factor IIF subunit 1-like n=1 Tax=Toxorhynchites rutilus septentrionalis TaxID=329112 RepID=UPI0024787BFB|nr:general transcription factor IIF subunit 1-like [Toxorhynchites rutilus septentrionalis]XP_055641417.1 general transcription factor IIF subunit 1-like [Toxorhynchites rutilus septentrionalis]XP_055641418.1 general transcription factor IIF subunit 1-like [Toxorhynchites rutilus septentrionalis]